MPAAPAVAWLPLLVRWWLAGVVVLTLRALGGWIVAQRLKSWKTTPAAGRIQEAATRLRGKLGLLRAVRVLNSAAAGVPSVVGWLRPVILLPVSTLTVLTPDQIEMVLAHELAHIRRHDYLVNLAQTAIETLLFYHPAVWWLSGRIRAEREHCCDDLAVAACGNPVGYAGALAALEDIEAAPPTLVVAASGGSLLRRIQRLLHRDGGHSDATPVWLGAMIPAAVLLVAMVSGTQPVAADPAPPARDRAASGFLGGLTAAGYTNISVDEIIALKEHGVEPQFIQGMLGAGMGTLSVKELIQLREHGVDPEYVAGVASSGLVNDLDVKTAIRLRENGADANEMAGIRKLGFGPYASDDVIRLRQNGVDEATFAALKEAGADRAGVADAIEFRQNGITVTRIRDMKRQGFGNLSLEQIVKLCRAGIV
jgi:beta-lactamase regulating signal transducer with metallopeptidase domain